MLSECTEAAMIADIYLKTLFVSTLAEGNPACQRCILGSEEGKPSPAEAAVKQWSCGCGLQRQCTEGRGICMPEHACARMHVLPSHAHTCSCLCLLYSFPRIPRCSGVPRNILSKSESSGCPGRKEGLQHRREGDWQVPRIKGCLVNNC